MSGLVVPLASLRSAESPACGEFPDLALAGSLAASWGLELLQILPVNDTGGDPSPYSALSAFALNPAYLRLSALPEASRPACAAVAAEEARLAAGLASDPRLRYGSWREAKLGFLARIFEAAWGKGRAGADALDADPGFAAWLEANAWVRAYSVFVELKDSEGGKPWWDWSRHRDPRPGDIEGLWHEPAARAGTRRAAWIQWRAEGQFAAAAAALAGAGIELMGDIPILLGLDSAEVWARRHIFRLDLRAGAPPDMYAALGQNWGFPLYDWDELARSGFAFWRERLAQAGKFYSAYRIDHVLGFFRIWALGEREATGYLGRFIPDAPVTGGELAARGFGPDRLRWLSRPHVRGERLLEAAGGDATAAMEAAVAVLDRIGNENLFLFKPGIRGERDILEAAERGAPGYGGPGMARSLAEALTACWRDRVLFEFEPDRYAFSWRFREASAWSSLSEAERGSLEALAAAKARESERIWGRNGAELLGAVSSASDMLPCAEDLGSVPDCVPETLRGLGILGLRVLRWTRDWELPGQPHVDAAAYPELSVACASVHDSSSLREWWEAEADRPAAWAFAGRALGASLGPPPARLDPEAAEILLAALSRSASRIVVHTAQDLCALSGRFVPADPREERVNVPGVVDAWNWGWRLPANLEEIMADPGLAAAARRVAAARRPPAASY